MKTLIINGSPKQNGDTEALVTELSKHIKGEVKSISCYDEISPCVDCRYCWTKSGCSIKDEMQEIYSYLDECDNVVLASPIWFSSLSGPVLNIASRMQTLFASHFFRKEPKKEPKKNGVIIFVGGQPGTEIAAEQSAKIILTCMGVNSAEIMTIKSMNTDKLPAFHDENAKAECRAVAQRLNRLELAR